MNIVITMGGLGKRFRDAGWNLPKYQIEAKGRTLFEWALLSLAYFKNEKHIFLVRGEDGAVAFIREKCAGLGIDDINVVELDHLTRGQAETALMAQGELIPRKNLLIAQALPLRGEHLEHTFHFGLAARAHTAAIATITDVLTTFHLGRGHALGATGHLFKRNTRNVLHKVLNFK